MEHTRACFTHKMRYRFPETIRKLRHKIPTTNWEQTASLNHIAKLPKETQTIKKI